MRMHGKRWVIEMCKGTDGTWTLAGEVLKHTNHRLSNGIKLSALQWLSKSEGLDNILIDQFT